MTGWNLACLAVGMFLAGAYVALLCRALVEESTQRRLARAAEDALAPEQLDRLREYLASVEEHERDRLKLAHGG